jgi:hypothetical protein
MNDKFTLMHGVEYIKLIVAWQRTDLNGSVGSATGLDPVDGRYECVVMVCRFSEVEELST